MSQERPTRSKEKEGFNVVQLLDQIQKIPTALLQTKEGAALIALLSGVALEAGGYSKKVWKLKETAFLDKGQLESLEKASYETAYCNSLDPVTRNTVCELKPKLNIEFDIWPWKGLAIPEDFGKFDMPVAKLLMLLGTMGMSAEFIKGVGGIVPG